MLEWMMVLGYRQNCQNWIKTFISLFCSVVLLFMFPLSLLYNKFPGVATNSVPYAYMDL